jgi:hypothetical protein
MDITMFIVILMKSVLKKSQIKLSFDCGASTRIIEIEICINVH